MPRWNAPAKGAGSQATSPIKANTLLWLLLVIYVLNFVDRQILNILAEPIAREIGLSDTQIGLLTGLAFAIFYTVLGLPLARLADNPKSDRVTLIAVCLTVWSGMTAISGFVQNFWHLLLARIGVGAGEAGCTPAAISIISDVVPLQKRASAMGLYMMGVPIGSLLGMLVGGILAEAVGWRTAFLLVGAPGVLFALLFWIAVNDPRKYSETVRQAAEGGRQAMPLWAALAQLSRSRAYLYTVAANSVSAFLSYGKAVWIIIFFMRSHELSTAQVGIWWGIASGVCGIIGSVAGGRLGDHFGSKNPSHYFGPAIVGSLIAAPFYVAAYLVHDWQLALLLLVLPTIASSLNYGPAMATTQALFKPELRATSTAVLLFVQTIVGLGLGPLLLGMLSDSLKPMMGGDSIRGVLLSTTILGLVPAILLWRAAAFLGRELKHNPMVEKDAQI